MSKSKLDSRKLMEQAIEVMQQSVHEARNDGKAGPLVGAVLYKPDGTVDTACRGELRVGDHAEFTLLERKNRHCRLDGSVLFATLEPCAPGSRHHPKVSCAERIVFARIKEVWVGIADPDPKVDRKGIKYLQDNGVTVHMFDRDLQEQIQAANKDFIAQATERAAAARCVKKPKAITLSNMEKALDTAVPSDLSKKALEQYCAITGINDSVDSAAFKRRLVQQGLLTRHEGNLVPTGFGMLLFGNEPRAAMPQAGLLGTVHYPDGQEEPRDFDGPMVSIPEQVEQWLRDKLPSTIDRSHMQRRKALPLPFELIREAVVNALIHRDYEITGAKCQLLVTSDTITVKSPGGPLPPITLEQLQSFNAPMLSRNPELHYVFAQLDLAEERGLGMKTLRLTSAQHGLPLPRYSFEPPYLVLTLYRTPESAVHVLTPAVLEVLNKDEKRAWQFLATKASVASVDLIKEMEVDEKKAQRILKKLLTANLIRRVGKGRATRYEVVRSGV